MGGLARRSYTIDSIRKTDNSVLLFDCGGLFANPSEADYQVKADITVKAMNLMGYDAVGLGKNDFLSEISYYSGKNADVRFPLIASNLIFDAGKFPWLKKYEIKAINGIRTAVVAVLPQDANVGSEFKVIPPEEALTGLIPELRKNSDAVILLSQADDQKTAALMEKVKGIDLAVSCEGGSEKSVSGVVLGDSQALGYLQFKLNDDGTVSVLKNSTIKLDDAVAFDERISSLIMNTQIDWKRTQYEEKSKKAHQESIKMLELNPKEFFEQYQKQQAEQQRLKAAQPEVPCEGKTQKN